MKLCVQYTAQLRTATGRPEESIDLPEGSSLAALLDHLAALRDEAAVHLLAPDGRAHRSLLLVVNGAAVAPNEIGALVLRPGDVVTLLPPIAGG